MTSLFSTYLHVVPGMRHLCAFRGPGAGPLPARAPLCAPPPETLNGIPHPADTRLKVPAIGTGRRDDRMEKHPPGAIAVLGGPLPTTAGTAQDTAGAD